MCAEIKPQFHRKSDGVLIKATQPMERVSIDFKGPLKSSTRNKYLLVAVDEYSRFPCTFPCPNMETSTFIKCLDSLFSLCSTAGFVHSDRGPSLMSEELRSYLLSRGIASSHSAAYSRRGNGQVERYVQTTWKLVLLSLKMHSFPTSEWERVMPEALHSMRSLINVSTNQTPHDRFFNFSRRSMCGSSTPSWLQPGNSVYVRKFVRQSTADPLVEKVELLHTNPSYAFIKYQDGRESSVSLRDLAPCPAVHKTLTDNPINQIIDSLASKTKDLPSNVPTPVDTFPIPELPQDQPTPTEDTTSPIVSPTNPSPTPRRSSRVPKQPVWMEDYER